MTKKIKKLEKETAMYRSRWESSNKALLEMAEEVKLRPLLVFSFLSTIALLRFIFVIKFGHIAPRIVRKNV